jgi:predicted hydrocarbon binding protein
MSGNSILDELAYDSASGALNFKDVRYMLIRPETVIGFQKAIEEKNRNLAQAAFFRGGFRGGYLSAKEYRELHDFDETQIINFMMKMGTEIGWGRFSLQKFDLKERHLSITVRHSPFAAAYGHSSSGVCHLIRGVLSGLASALFNKECIGSEVKCLAKGDEHCFFEILAP